MALMTPQEYIDSLRKLNTRVYMFGEKIDNWVDHPMIRPSINPRKSEHQSVSGRSLPRMGSLPPT